MVVDRAGGNVGGERRQVTVGDELVGLNLAHAECVVRAGLQARKQWFQSLVLHIIWKLIGRSSRCL